MDRQASLAFLDELIANQRKARRIQLGLVLGPLLCGLCLVAAGTMLVGLLLTDYWKWLLTLGGGLVSSLSASPAKDLFNTKDAIAALLLLRTELEGASPLVDGEGGRRAELETKVAKLFDKKLGIG